MAKIELNIPKTVFVAGDEVNGKVILTCDKRTECKSFKAVIEGKLTAGATTVRYFKNKRVEEPATETFVIHQDEISLAPETAFDPGTHEFEFEFKLPEDAKTSYDGRRGSIEYAVSALMDISWKTKPKASKPITVIQSLTELNPFPDGVKKKVAEHEGEAVLEVEIDSQRYCIGNKISFRYRVNTDMKFNNLRAEIEHNEKTSLEGKAPKYHTAFLWEEKISSFDVIRHEWNNWTLDINKDFPPWLMYENIESGIRLKVILGRSYRLDKSVEIPLVSGHCLEAIESAEEEVVPEERPRPKRLRCNICSYTFKPKDDDVDSGTCPSCGRSVPF
ncbi:MAG: hypothetical protein ACXAEN_09065 [Candidatus Thorarchaeota archaeon]|jgi:hypothetical protein